MLKDRNGSDAVCRDFPWFFLRSKLLPSVDQLVGTSRPFLCQAGFQKIVVIAIFIYTSS